MSDIRNEPSEFNDLDITLTILINFLRLYNSFFPVKWKLNDGISNFSSILSVQVRRMLLNSSLMTFTTFKTSARRRERLKLDGKRQRHDLIKFYDNIYPIKSWNSRSCMHSLRPGLSSHHHQSPGINFNALFTESLKLSSTIGRNENLTTLIRNRSINFNIIPKCTINWANRLGHLVLHFVRAITRLVCDSESYLSRMTWRERIFIFYARP